MKIFCSCCSYNLALLFYTCCTLWFKKALPSPCISHRSIRGLLSLCPIQMWLASLGLDIAQRRHCQKRVSMSQRAVLPGPMEGSGLNHTRSFIRVSCTPHSVVCNMAEQNHPRKLSAQYCWERITFWSWRQCTKALQYFLPYLRGKHVMVQSDNTSTVYHIKRLGRPS